MNESGFQGVTAANGSMEEYVFDENDFRVDDLNIDELIRDDTDNSKNNSRFIMKNQSKLSDALHNISYIGMDKTQIMEGEDGRRVPKKDSFLVGDSWVDIGADLNHQRKSSDLRSSDLRQNFASMLSHKS